MSTEQMSGVEDLMMGNVSENVAETDEKISDRIVAAQQKIAAIKKDEQSSQGFDNKLAALLSGVSIKILDFIIFLIDHGVPSLTILAMISLEVPEAGKICYSEFHKYIAETADFSVANLSKETEEKISLWWTFIFASNYISKTLKLNQLRTNDVFVQRISKEFSDMLKNFLVQKNEKKFDPKALKKILKTYADKVFSKNPLG